MSDVTELISRMCVEEPRVNSSESISWHAHREAEQLNDTALLEEMAIYLSKKRTKAERSASYFVIGKIGRNTKSIEAYKALISHISTETDKYAISTALRMIADLSLNENEDIRPLISLLNDPRWLVRQSAIEALRSSKALNAELSLIALLQSTTNDADKVYCHSTLSVIGTERSLNAIEESVKSRKRDVKSSAVFALEKIRERYAQHVAQGDCPERAAP